MSKQYRVCSDKSPAQFKRNQPEKPTLKLASLYTCVHSLSLVILVDVAVMVIAKIETFEENAEAGEPFFLSDVVCCVRVEELENPVMIQQCIQMSACIFNEQ